MSITSYLKTHGIGISNVDATFFGLQKIFRLNGTNTLNRLTRAAEIFINTPLATVGLPARFKLPIVCISAPSSAESEETPLLEQQTKKRAKKALQPVPTMSAWQKNAEKHSSTFKDTSTELAQSPTIDSAEVINKQLTVANPEQAGDREQLISYLRNLDHHNVNLDKVSIATLAQALSLSCGKDNWRSIIALLGLHQFNPLQVLKNPLSNHSGKQDRSSDVWRLLQTLARVPGGMDIIQKLTQIPLNEEQERCFKVYLIASDKLIEQNPEFKEKQAFRPSDLLSYFRGNSLLENALSGSINILKDSGQASQLDKYSVNAVNNGFDSDAKDSLLEKANQRVNKLKTWVDRALKGSFLLHLNPLTGKTPFRSMLKHGAQCVQNAAMAEHETERLASHKKGIGFLLAQSSLSPTLKPTNELSKKHVCAALLDYWDTIKEHALNNKSLTVDTDALTTYLSSYKRDSSKTVDQVLSPEAKSYLNKLQGKALDLDLLKALGREILNKPKTRFYLRAYTRIKVRLCEWIPCQSAVKNQSDKQQIAKQQRHTWQEFNQMLQKAGRQSGHAGSTDIIPKNEEGLKDAIDELVNEIQHDARLSFTSGGVYGASTKSLSIACSKILTATIARLRVDMGMERGHEAVFEVYNSSDGIEIFIGSQKRLNRSVGVGVGVGAGWNIPGSAGGSIDLHPYISNSTDASGVVLRIPNTPFSSSKQPTKEDKENANREAKKQLSNLLKSLLVDNTPTKPSVASKKTVKCGGEKQPLLDKANADDLTLSPLKRAMAENPYLSVSPVNIKGAQSKRAASLSVTSSVGLGGPARASFSAGITGERITHSENEREEVAGQTRVVRSSFGAGTRVGVFGGATFGTAHKVTDGTTLGITSTDLVGASATVYSNQKMGKQKLAYINGQLDASTTYRDIEYTTLASFKKTAESEKGYWKDASQIDAFLKMAESRLHLNQVFQQRYKLKPEVAKQINNLNALKLLAEQNHDPAAQNYEKMADCLLNASSSWYLATYRVFNQNHQNSRWRVPTPVRIGSNHVANGMWVDSTIDQNDTNAQDAANRHLNQPMVAAAAA